MLQRLPGAQAEAQDLPRVMLSQLCRRGFIMDSRPARFFKGLWMLLHREIAALAAD
jgi:hypothetical protein